MNSGEAMPELTATTTTLKHRVTQLLATQPGRALCTQCIARTLGLIPRRIANVIMLLDPAFCFRRSDLCADCHAARLVTVYVTAASGTR